MHANETINGNAEIGGGWRGSRWRLTAWATVVTLILLIPLIAMQFTDEVQWTPFDFIIMGTLMMGVGVAYEFAMRMTGSTLYRAAVGVALAAGFLLMWVNGAVGVIGDVDSANMLFFGVHAVAFIGSVLGSFRPAAMARAMFAAAAVQALVPFIALAWVPAADFAPGFGRVLILNSFFIAMWITSAVLFREAARGSAARPAA